MPAQTVIDSLEFARTGQSLRGQLVIAELNRIKDILAGGAGEVRFGITGLPDVRGRPALALEISGMLQLQCQRCLGTLEYRLLVSNTLLLGTADEMGELEAGEAEWIEASRELDVAGLVEDEIILSLPYSPRHAEGSCGPAAAAAEGGSGTAFSKLAALKRTH